jgi:hypothetical protein
MGCSQSSTAVSSSIQPDGLEKGGGGLTTSTTKQSKAEGAAATTKSCNNNNERASPPASLSANSISSSTAQSATTDDPFHARRHDQPPKPSKLKPGYSSGGSSYNSVEDGSDSRNDGGGHDTSASVNIDENDLSKNTKSYVHQTSSKRHDTLIDIKKDLKAESDIACGVVRIEVSMFIMMRESFSHSCISQWFDMGLRVGLLSFCLSVLTLLTFCMNLFVIENFIAC